MDNFRPARLLLAHAAGATLDRDTLRAALPASVTIVTHTEIPGSTHLPEPFEEIPLLAHSAAYAGEPLAVLVGDEWSLLDAIPPEFGQSDPSSQAREADIVAWEEERSEGDGAPDEEKDAVGDQIVEGIYTTSLQLHHMDEPLWAACRRDDGVYRIVVPTQWPAHAHRGAAEALGIAPAEIVVESTNPGAVRDGALQCASRVAALAAVCAHYIAAPVVVRLRLDQRHLSGGRAPAQVRWTSRLDQHGEVKSNEIDITFDTGAYAALAEETKHRARLAVGSIYQKTRARYLARSRRSTAIPMIAFEGVGTSQLAFAREVHYNRLAELAHADPIEWRRPHFRPDLPIVEQICKTLADESDFHRRHAANELVRKRRLLLPRYSSYLKGIGCSFSDQYSGFMAGNERGSVTVTLETDGTARLRCTIPTPSRRLQHTWRAIVADELALDRDAVVLEQLYEHVQDESGPRLFSRGVAIVPRKIVSACQGIQKRRFRDPLPITVRRTLGGGRSAGLELSRSIAGTVIETSILPATMQIEVRSVTMAVHAGRVFDRGAAEAELHRGIFQALTWTLHESVPDPRMLNDYRLLRGYDATFRGRPPRIRIVFVNAPMRRDFSAGVGELPFLTVPAALISALSQASGLYLDTLPARPRTILAMLREE